MSSLLQHTEAWAVGRLLAFRLEGMCKMFWCVKFTCFYFPTVGLHPSFYLLLKKKKRNMKYPPFLPTTSCLDSCLHRLDTRKGGKVGKANSDCLYFCLSSGSRHNTGLKLNYGRFKLSGKSFWLCSILRLKQTLYSFPLGLNDPLQKISFSFNVLTMRAQGGVITKKKKNTRPPIKREISLDLKYDRTMSESWKRRRKIKQSNAILVFSRS